MYVRFQEHIKKRGIETYGFANIRNTMGIETMVRVLTLPQSEDEFVFLLRLISCVGLRAVVLGKMSNVLFKESAFDGIVIVTSKFNIKKLAEHEMCFSSGVMLASVYPYMLENCIGGFEGLYAIPGSIGGMLRQNAGAFGYEISDLFKKALIYDIQADNCYEIKNEDMKFSYRNSLLADEKKILLNACFERLYKPRELIKQNVGEISRIRHQTQPLDCFSLGSIFKRVGDKSAGYYIDRAGLKGCSVGSAEVSQKHAGFIVNRGCATSNDVLKLIGIIKERVLLMFKLELEEEIQII